MLHPFKVDVSPEMGIYRLLQSQSYSIYSALSEFVDNSIQSYIENKEPLFLTHKENRKLKIKISVNNDTRQIVISDNAAGINKANFQRAIKMGTDIKHDKTSLSRFGVGMKTAAVWFSNTWKIETSALSSDEKLVSEFNLDKLLTKGETEILVSREREKKKNHYTRITIANPLREESKEYYQKKVMPHLAETFIKFKDFLSIEIEYDGEILPKKWRGKDENPYFEPPEEPLNFPKVNAKGKPIDRTYINWRKNINLNYKGHQVKGYVMIVKRGSTYTKQPGLRLFRNRRVIEGTILKPNRPEIIYGIPGRPNFGILRIYGEIHLNDFEVDFMKTKFSGNLTPLYQKLKEDLQKEDFIEQVKNYRKAHSESFDSEESHTKEIIVKPKNGIPKRKKINANNTNIFRSGEIELKLSKLEYSKLCSLYKELCDLPLRKYPHLSYVGGCIFLECLSSYMGNPDGNSFYSFLKSKSDYFYSDNKGKKQAIQRIISSIKETTNDIKHYHERDIVNAQQLVKDFKVLDNFIIKCIDDIQS